MAAAAPSVTWEQVESDDSRSSIYFSPISVSIVSSANRVYVEGLISELAEDSEAGRMLPFRGPVRDTLGTSMVSSGRYPSDDDLLEMCWFVQGIYQIDYSDPVSLVPGEVPASCR